MKFVDNLTKEEYKNFWTNHNEAHFLNSYEWGIVNKENRNQEPIYVGLKDNKNNLLAATLLLKKKTPLNMCYFYASKGYLIDWNDKKLVKEFTNHLKDYLKKENAIYLKVDPDIIYQDIDLDANPIPNGNNNYKLYDYLLSLGYKHKGFNKLYEGNQPRYTFRTIFKDYKSFDEIEKTISKTFMRSIKRSYNYDLIIEEDNTIDTFYELIKKVSLKDNFKSYTKKYYQDVYNLFKEDGYIKNLCAKINPKEIINKYQKELETEKNEDRKIKIQKDIDFFNNLDNQEEHVIASLICIYTEKGAWSLYIGNDEVAEYTGTVNRLYYEFIKDAYESKKEYADLFGVVGDPKTKYKNLAGIYEYKRKLGGTYLEFIGEFDLINKPFWYKVLPILLKIYRTIKK